MGMGQAMYSQPPRESFREFEKGTSKEQLFHKPNLFVFL